MEEDGAEDDSGVVDEGREGLVEEDFADLEARAHNAADEEEKLRGQDEACHGGAEGGLEGIVAEAFVGKKDVLGGEDFGQENADAEDDEHGGEDDGERAVAAFFVAGFAVTVEDGDERDGGGSADEEVGEEVGKFEGGAVGVLRDACAEEEVDVFDADEGKDSRENGREHEEEGGGVCAVSGGGFEESQGVAACSLCRRVWVWVGRHGRVELILSAGLMLMGWLGWFVLFR
jgi:hypothetical protein